MYAIEHNNVLVILVAPSFGHYDHYQAKVIQNLKRLVHVVHKVPSCIGSHLYQCQYLLSA
jgi:hypothetical protein